MLRNKKVLLLQSIALSLAAAALLVTASYAWFFRDTRVEMIHTNVGKRGMTVEFYYLRLNRDENKTTIVTPAMLYGDDTPDYALSDHYDLVDTEEETENLYGSIIPGIPLHFLFVVKNTGNLGSKLSVSFMNIYDDSGADEEGEHRELLVSNIISDVTRVYLGSSGSWLEYPQLPGSVLDSYRGRKFENSMFGPPGARSSSLLENLSLPGGDTAYIFYSLSLSTEMGGEAAIGWTMTMKYIYFTLA